MTFCTNCGARLPDNAASCGECGAAVPRANASAGDDAALRMVIPIGRSGWAIAAGYLGLVSVIPFVGILAIATGVLAISSIKKHPEKHGLGRAWFGIVMGALFTVLYIVCLVSLLVTMPTVSP